MSRWQQVFDRLDVTWCPMCSNVLGNRHRVHARGRAVAITVDSTMVLIHWTDRRYTRAGAAKALRLLAVAIYGYKQLGMWEQIYHVNQLVLAMAKQAHVGLPRSTFDLDRARLRFLLGEITIQERRTWTKEQREMYRKALRWAARS